MMRVVILLYEEDDELIFLKAELLSYLRKVGFAADYASKSLQELDMDPSRVAEFVSANPSDAWVVIAASSTVLEWFSRQPTAIIVQEPAFMMAVMQFLKERGLATPSHVSLFCMDYTASFDWCDPQPAHSRWDQKKVIHRIVEWTTNVSNGEKDITHTIFDSEFIEGAPSDHHPPRSGTRGLKVRSVW